MIEQGILEVEGQIHRRTMGGSTEAIENRFNTASVGDRHYYTAEMRRTLDAESDRWSAKHNKTPPTLKPEHSLILSKIMGGNYQDGYKARKAIIRILNSFRQEEEDSQPKIDLSMLRKRAILKK
tara:strand:+ start:1603 stop:1974 length:372 start_codon:yes stop_codon:yes gene_type:complete